MTTGNASGAAKFQPNTTAATNSTADHKLTKPQEEKIAEKETYKPKGKSHLNGAQLDSSFVERPKDVSISGVGKIFAHFLVALPLAFGQPYAVLRGADLLE